MANVPLAQKIGARAPYRGHVAISWLGLIDKVVVFYIPIASIFYFTDLLLQTKDGLTDGAGRSFGDDFIYFWSGPFLSWHQRAAEIYTLNAFHVFEQGVVGRTYISTTTVIRRCSC